VGEDLEEADHGEVPDMSHEARAFGGQAVTPKAEHLEVGQGRPETLHQLGRVEVA
jgi:hypothetical protein